HPDRVPAQRLRVQRQVLRRPVMQLRRWLAAPALVLALLAPASAALAAPGAEQWGFRGFVRDGQRNPVTGAVVEVQADGKPRGTDTTDDKGRWEVLGLPGPGRYLLVFDTSRASAHFTGGDRYEVQKELVRSGTTLPVQNLVVSTSQSAVQVASLG